MPKASGPFFVPPPYGPAPNGTRCAPPPGWRCGMRRVISTISLVLISSAAQLLRLDAQELQFPPLLEVGLTRSAVVGQEKTHLVVASDTLQSLSARYGVDAKVLAAENDLAAGAALTPGLTLVVPSRHILPPDAQDGILINIPQRHLFHVRGGQVVGAYPIAVGRGDWRTPTGGFHVAVKETDPSWEVPKSIQQEMRSQ